MIPDSDNARFSSARSRSARAHSDGPPERVSVVQYGDFGCAACGRATTTIKLLRDRFREQIRFEYQHFPRSRHPHAMQAAEAAECARAQGRFWQMHNLLFANQDHLDLKHLYSYAEQLTLDIKRFTTEMDDEVHLPAVHAHVESGLARGVRTTPTFMVNGRLVDLSAGFGSLFDAVGKALTGAQPWAALA